MSTKPTLVLIHGWGISADIWQSFLPYLDHHYSLLPLNMPGYAPSDTPTDTPSDTQNAHPRPATIESVTEHILAQCPDQAYFCGWSLGGLISQYIASHYPERCQGLVAIASSPKFVSNKTWPGMPEYLLDSFANNLSQQFKKTVLQFIQLQFLGSPTHRNIIQDFKTLFLESPDVEISTLDDGLMILKNTDLREKLSSIQCPQLYLFGKNDKIVPAAVADRIPKLSPQARTTVIQKCSHAPFLSHPELCAQAIIETLG